MFKLFTLSRKYFWIFLEVCGPMLKMGVRKASMLRKAVDKIMTCLKTVPYDTRNLNSREEMMFETLQLFMETSFSDGEACLALPQLESLPFAEGFSEKGYLMATNFKDMVKNIDNISYITLGKDVYHKTSKLFYYMCKYKGDITIKELRNLSIKEILKIITKGAEEEVVA